MDLIRTWKARWYALRFDLYRNLLLPPPTKTSNALRTWWYGLLINDYLRLLRKIEQGGERLLYALQRERLGRLFRAAQRAPAWQRRLPDKARPLSDGFTTLSRIPSLRRQELLEDTESFLTKPFDPRRMVWGRSSGSTTGTPIRVALEKRLITVDVLAHNLRQYVRYGFDFTRAQNTSFYTCIDYRSTYNPFEYFMAGQFFLHGNGIDSTSEVARFVQTTRNLEQSVLVTTPESLRLLLRILTTTSEKPKLSFCNVAGQALDEQIRRDAEAHLGCPVRASYGTQEVGRIAEECEREYGTFHIASERIVIEICGEDDTPLPNGVAGRMLLTCLDSTLMPLIRYEIGDRGVILSEKCSCGLVSPRLRVEGRLSDNIRLPDGTLKPAKPLFKLFAREPFLSHARKIQIRQSGPDALEIVLESDHAFPETLLNSQREKIERWYNFPFSITFRTTALLLTGESKFVPFIPLQPVRVQSGTEDKK